MRLFAWLLLCLSAFLSSASARSSTGDSVLVVTDAKLELAQYTTFWDGLRSRGYELTFRRTNETAPETSAYEVPAFSHIILFAPSTKTWPTDLSPQSLVNLLTTNTNLLIVLQSSTPSSPLRDLAREFGIAFPPPSTPLIDYFSAANSSVTPTNLLLHPPVSPHTPSIKAGDQIFYTGIAHLRSSNPLLVPFLNAPATSYSADPVEGTDAVVEAAGPGGEGLWAGSQMGLATGFEVLGGGGRAMWVGSLELFSDSSASSAGFPVSNAAYAQDLAAWTFQETSVFRIDGVKHHRAGKTEPLQFYRVKDDIVFAVNISAYDASTSTFVPTSALKDLQLEFTMLDPHIRTSILPVPGSPYGTYEAHFRAPDRHGVFKFIIDWRRKGYTRLSSVTTVSVVPFRHNEYPRFLSSAWPYYAGALSTSAGFVLFCAVWLLGGEQAALEKKKQ